MSRDRHVLCHVLCHVLQVRAAMAAGEPQFRATPRAAPFSYALLRGLPPSPDVEPDAEGALSPFPFAADPPPFSTRTHNCSAPITRGRMHTCHRASKISVPPRALWAFISTFTWDCARLLRALSAVSAVPVSASQPVVPAAWPRWPLWPGLELLGLQLWIQRPGLEL